MKTIGVGIDISKKKADVCVKSEFEVMDSFAVSNDVLGIKKLKKRLARYKKTIVEYFVNRSPRGYSYKVRNEQDIFRRFGNRNIKEMQEAFNQLVEDKIIITEMSNEKRYYLLDFIDKPSEIREILRKEPFIERAKMIRPEKEFFDGFDNIFNRVTERAWPNRGTYYYCIKKDNPEFWKVVIRTKPNVKPNTYVLGDLKDPESRISKMWQVILRVWIENERKPIWKKKAEDADQKVFGNNRQPSTCGFQIFEHLGWLKETRKKGNVIYFVVTDENAYNKFLRDRGIN